MKLLSFGRVCSIGDPMYEPVLISGFDSGLLQLGNGQDIYFLGVEVVNKHVNLLRALPFYVYMIFFQAEALRDSQLTGLQHF